MTPRFILDENVVILAQRGLDENDAPNSACSDLVQQIIEICHTIVVDDILWDKFEEQLNRQGYHQLQLGPHLMRALWNALTIPRKIDGLGHTAPAFNEEGAIPPGSLDDAHIVRLAVESGAVLVTTDRKLRDHLTESGIGLNHNLTVVSPEDALNTLLDPSEPTVELK